MCLLDAKIGDRVRVVGFSGRKMTSKLQQVGVYPGDRLQIVRQAPLGGPLLVRCDGREMALGRGVAARILVEVE
jgi:ferrous iron transport protein A